MERTSGCVVAAELGVEGTRRRTPASRRRVGRRRLRGRRAGGRHRACPDTLPTCRDASPTLAGGGTMAATVSRPGGRGTGRLRDRVEEGRDSAEQGAG